MRSSFYRMVPALFLLGTLPALAQEGTPNPAPPAEQKPAAAPAAPATSAGTAAAAAPAAHVEEHCTGEVAVCVKQIVEKLKKRGWIGMDVALNPDTNLPVVNSVTPGSPADNGGLKVGDLLLGQNGVRFDNKKHEDLEAVEAPHRQLAPGDVMTYTVRRDGKEMELDVLLVEAPEDMLATWLGLTMFFDYYKDAAAAPAAVTPPAPKPGN